MEIIERKYIEVKHQFSKEDVLNRLIHYQNIKKFISLTKLRNINVNLEINFIKMKENKTYTYESKLRNFENNFQCSKYMFLSEILDGIIKKRQYHFLTILKLFAKNLKAKNNNELKGIKTFYNIVENKNINKYKIEEKNQEEQNIEFQFEEKNPNNNRQRFSEVLYLLSQKYHKNIDERFLNEQIKHFVLKNKITNKNILNLVSDNNIEIDQNEFDKKNKIRKRERLLKLYMAIEMFYPLDLIFFKRKQTYNRHFFKRIYKYIKMKEFEKKIIYVKKIFSKLEKKFLIQKEIGIKHMKYNNSLLKKTEKFGNFLSFLFKLKKSLICHIGFENIKKMNKNKWIFVVLHNIFYRTKLFNFMVLKLNLGNFSKKKHSLNMEYTFLNSAILKSMNKNLTEREKNKNFEKKLSIPELLSNRSSKKIKNNPNKINLKKSRPLKKNSRSEIIKKKINKIFEYCEENKLLKKKKLNKDKEYNVNKINIKENQKYKKKEKDNLNKIFFEKLKQSIKINNDSNINSSVEVFEKFENFESFSLDESEKRDSYVIKEKFDLKKKKKFKNKSLKKFIKEEFIDDLIKPNIEKNKNNIDKNAFDKKIKKKNIGNILSQFLIPEKVLKRNKNNYCKRYFSFGSTKNNFKLKSSNIIENKEKNKIDIKIPFKKLTKIISDKKKQYLKSIKSMRFIKKKIKLFRNINRRLNKGLKILSGIFKKNIKKTKNEVFYILSLYLEIIEVLEVVDMSNVLEPQMFASNMNLLNSNVNNNYISPIIKNSNIENSNILRNNINNSNIIRNNINNSNIGFINKSQYFDAESQIHRYENILKSNLQKITTLADVNQNENFKSQYLKSTSCFNNIKNTKKYLNNIQNNYLKPNYNMNKIKNNNLNSQILTSFVIDSKSNTKLKNSNSTKKIIKRNLFKDKFNSVSPSISSLLISEHRF